MQPGPFARQQVSGYDLADQGMTDLIAVLARSGH